MIEGRCAWKDRLSDENLCQDASHAPDIRRLAVGVRAKEYLGRSVPSGGDFLGQDDVLVGLVGDEGAGESEVADLHGAVAVEEQVGGLEVAVDDLCGVQELEPLGELVQNEPVVRVLEDLLSEWKEQYPMALWRSASMNSKTR